MKPFDLDALEIETDTEPFTFTFGGEEFTIASHLDPRLQRRARNGDLDGVLLAMIGKEQYERLDQIDRPFYDVHLLKLIEEWAEHNATTVGEASASSSSSKSTGRQSKRTSNGSTESPSSALSPDPVPSSTGEDSASL